MQDRATVRDAKLRWSPGGPSVWPTGCFQPGFIHGTTISRIRAVTDSNKAAHRLFNLLQRPGDKQPSGAGRDEDQDQD
ncbi:hypothetical protein VZT92_004670 [Zoarces viviparus]|uniref:Uncharacterized protein n=1 Tax=Zoarces viviparus TaxID=48416 RepID=A0AAW1FXV7_ZOAVI